MTDNDKLICHLYAVKGVEYVSKGQLQGGVVTLYKRVNELLFELFCVDPGNAQFKGMDEATRARMMKGKMERMEAQGKEENLKEEKNT